MTRSGETHCDKKIRVILVDESEAMRNGLRHMLSQEESITVVGEVSDGNNALARARALGADIILMDIGVQAINGISVARSLMEAGLEMGIIILADNRDYLAPTLEAGAVGFLPRNINRENLIRAVRIVHLWRLSLFDKSQSHFALVKL